MGRLPNCSTSWRPYCRATDVMSAAGRSLRLTSFGTYASSPLETESDEARAAGAGGRPPTSSAASSANRLRGRKSLRDTLKGTP